MGKIAVLYGGKSAEREVSLRSGEAVFEALKSQGFHVLLHDTNSENLMRFLQQEKIERCVIMLHGGDGEDGHVQAMLEMLNIPFTGSDVLGCALAMDKVKSKYIWQALSLPTPKFEIIDEEINVEGLKYPLAIKPIVEGSSVGISKVDRQADLRKAYELASRFGAVMAEEWIEGREFTVSIVNDIALPSIWIEPARDFYDYDAKYSPGTNYHCPSGLNEGLEKEISRLAKQAFKALGCSSWGRVDFMLSSKTQHLYLIEANTVPGMTNLSLVPQAAKQYGWDFNELVVRILKSSL